MQGCAPSDRPERPDGNVSFDIDASLATLGEKLYFDENLSNPAGQSCASCHLPEAGFADPDQHFPVSEGVISSQFGARNAPTASYAAHIPDFSFDQTNNGGEFTGGQFWDGRASTLEDQAKGPFLNPLEMNMADAKAVVDAVRVSEYAEEFEQVFGASTLLDSESAFEFIAQAIAEFERTDLFSPFTSKFDAVQADDDVFTQSEANGQGLFNQKADCRRCHNTNGNGAEFFTDFEYKNVGVPANPNNPFLTLDASFNPDGTEFIDFGLGAVLNESNHNGKFRTPTLRNIATTAPYMHNGVFNTLEEVIQFYNRRDVDQIEAEVDDNVDNGGNIGNLELTQTEIADLADFLRTLTDNYQ
ncbi:MAG: cytochrome c peroxidase [Gammaproteobacteria bacterium]|jgi:cytochrome c peroxidase